MSKKAREAGIRAIIELQALAGIIEPRDRAAANWDRFGALERIKTMAAHRQLCGRHGPDRGG